MPERVVVGIGSVFCGVVRELSVSTAMSRRRPRRTAPPLGLDRVR